MGNNSRSPAVRSPNNSAAVANDEEEVVEVEVDGNGEKETNTNGPEIGNGDEQ